MTRSPLLLTALTIGGGCTDYDLSKLGDGQRGPDDRGPEVQLEEGEHLDVLSQNEDAAVDVLFVVDDSCSMEQERDKLINNFDAFLEPFLDAEVDWHVGVVTTDILDMTVMGHLRQAEGHRYLTPDTEDPERVFRKMVDAGTDGSLVEGSALAIYEAIAQPRAEVQRWNAGFFRPGAPFHVVAVSDEDEQSAGVLPYEEFVPWFRTLGEPYSFSAVAGPSPDGCVSADTDAEPGTAYQMLTEALGGVFADICAPDWGPVLGDLGAMAALQQEFFLSLTPAEGSLEVWIEGDGSRRDGVDLETLGGDDLATACADEGLQRCVGYRYDEARNSVFFADYAPPRGAEVYAVYVPID